MTLTSGRRPAQHWHGTLSFKLHRYYDLKLALVGGNVFACGIHNLFSVDFTTRIVLFPVLQSRQLQILQIKDQLPSPCRNATEMNGESAEKNAKVYKDLHKNPTQERLLNRGLRDPSGLEIGPTSKALSFVIVLFGGFSFDPWY